MCKLQVTKKVEGLQDWIKNLVDICKSNRKVCLYLDTRTTIMTIKRGIYPIPILDLINDEMYGPKVFAKLDMNEACTQIKVEE